MKYTMNATKKLTEHPMHSEEYRGHRIQSAMRPVNKKNPISGHEWTEHEVLSTFSVSVQENSLTPTRPALGWTKMPFRTVKAAKGEVDGQIRLALLVAREAHKAGDKPNGTHFEETWSQAVLLELAGQSKGPEVDNESIATEESQRSDEMRQATIRRPQMR